MADALGNVDTFDYALRAGGKMYIKEYSALGVLPPAWTYLGETHNVNHTAESEDVEILNTESCTQSVGSTSTKSSKLTIDFETYEYSPKNMALAFLGTESTLGQLVQTAQAVVTEAVTEGGYTFIGYYGTTVLVVEDVTDTTTYVLNTDYTFDADSGLLGIIIGGGIETDDILHLTVTAPAYDGATVQYIDSVTKELSLMFIGCPSSGDKIKTEFYKVKLTANGAIGMKGDEYMPIAMVGTCIADTSQTTGSEYAQSVVLPNSA